ncbi:MAG: P63C domain-containing protein [Treponema sp.]|jgi:hypothetical protein|nr:P63C domain-containing protein [Treponema sp.]
MSETSLKSTHDGFLSIGGINLECHVLEDGRRIFSSRGILKAFDLQSEQKDQPRVLKGFLSKIRLISLPDKELANPLTNPIKFKRSGKGGLTANGYPAELLPEICDAVLKLQNKYMLPIDYRKAAERSRVFLSIFAKIGIIALIDEATGYQEVRDRNALQEILDKYLRKEYAAWAKRFPDEFYIEMFRLKNWQWKGMKINRPSVVGTYTNDIVYSRLAPGVLKELQRRNPPVDNGKRKVKHHQWLTEGLGHPALSHHLYALVALMKAAQDWGQFYRNLKKAFPVIGDQIEIDVEE